MWGDCDDSQRHLQCHAHLNGSCSLGVKAVADQHEERVAHAPQDLHGLRVCHAQQALVVHLQYPHPHLQPPIPRSSPRGAHLEHTRETRGHWGRAEGTAECGDCGGEGVDSTQREQQPAAARRGKASMERAEQEEPVQAGGGNRCGRIFHVR